MGPQRIRELRTQLDLSQERFAWLVGVSVQTVRRWESGLARPLPIISQKLEDLVRQTDSSPHSGGGAAMRGTGERGSARADFGFGGMLKGIGGLLEVVAKMVEEGRDETSRTGHVETAGGAMKGVYGFSVRLGLGGEPVIQPFGNIRETAAGPVVAETHEPLVDVMDEGDRLTVVVELPGVEEKDIRVRLEGNTLGVAASTGKRKYLKSVSLPWSPDPGRLKSFYRNGVLEIQLTRQEKTPG